MQTDADRAVTEAPFKGIQYSQVVDYYFGWKELQEVYKVLAMAPDWVRRPAETAGEKPSATEMITRMILYTNMHTIPEDFLKGE
jgi:hypothetical protein